jgi:hypothetical protein
MNQLFGLQHRGAKELIIFIWENAFALLGR